MQEGFATSLHQILRISLRIHQQRRAGCIPLLAGCTMHLSPYGLPLFVSPRLSEVSVWSSSMELVTRLVHTAGVSRKKHKPAAPPAGQILIRLDTHLFLVSCGAVSSSASAHACKCRSFPAVRLTTDLGLIKWDSYACVRSPDYSEAQYPLSRCHLYQNGMGSSI